MRVVSLFSGAGGLDLGFILAGHEVVWANDIDKDCVATYRLNIGTHILEAPVSDIRGNDVPDCDIVIGGFPCQGFSRANLHRAADDTRNLLYKEFVRFVGMKQPRHFVAENVRGILSLEKGAVLLQILQDLSQLGYHVEYRLFNTADYGVPQIRQRVIFLGTRLDISPEFRPGFPSPTHSAKPNSALLPWVSIEEALKGIPEPEEVHALPNHVYSKYKVTNRNFTGHRLTDPEKPSPTILARGNGKGGVVAIQHPKNHRRMSVRESATVQTFPLDFKFEGSLNSMYRQVGNAVPVLFARKIAEQFQRGAE